ncbi:MAG: adenosine deaminase [Actinomycetota bacterium]|nr:adenosine deaminase [Actinomycetota bacterium]
MPAARDLRTLPKAHLHLHFTGSMRPGTLLELAAAHGVRLPNALTSAYPPRLSTTDARGWFRFQRLYDTARSVLRTPDDVRRVVFEAAQDDAAEGSGWLELQVDPSGYPGFGGLTPFVELMLDAARQAQASTGVGVGIVIAANRTRHPLDARTLARLAARYAGAGVVGFGLSNDERRGRTADFAPAFRIARNAGLLSVPHGGELLGPASVIACLDLLGADRLGHGVRAVEDPRVLDQLATRGVVCEVCPWSNLSLGVAPRAADVPLRVLRDAGVGIALGADDPLLFGARLVAQYEFARARHGFSDTEIADLARSSIQGSAATPALKADLLARVSDWLADG